MRKREKYIKIDSRFLSIITGIVIGLIFIIVFLVGHKSALIELQITLSVISGILFIFLFLGLYKGIKIKAKHITFGSWKFLSKDSLTDLSGIDVPDIGFPDMVDGIDDIAGVIMAILLWIVVAIVLVAFLFFVANILWGVIFFLLVALYWIFYRAYRQVFIKSRKCIGNLRFSLLYSLYYTILYTGWIFIITFVVRLIKTI
ncbi:MAG: DUF2244 domain-containing protein [Clostridia bacterium]|nr:DUF2244 domain-containing protein [Clostridia bacterium]